MPLLLYLSKHFLPVGLYFIRMRWAGHVARMGEKRNAYRVLVGKPEERDHWEDQDVGGWTISKWILERMDEMLRIRLIWLRIRTNGRLL
jgi:hypothetical protein